MKYQANIKNVVAVSGTAFTDGHALALSKLCKTIYVAYDGDSAGIQAAIRAGYTIIKNNLDAKIIQTPNKLDPDEWIQKEGVEGFKQAYKNAKDLLEFHYEIVSEEMNTERDKIEFINTVLFECNNIDNELTVELLSKKLAELTGFSLDTILNTLKKMKQKQYKKIETEANEAPSIIEEKISAVEKELITFCFN